jgi:hypothetical protein
MFQNYFQSYSSSAHWTHRQRDGEGLQAATGTGNGSRAEIQKLASTAVGTAVPRTCKCRAANLGMLVYILMGLKEQMKLLHQTMHMWTKSIGSCAYVGASGRREVAGTAHCSGGIIARNDSILSVWDAYQCGGRCHGMFHGMFVY